MIKKTISSACAAYFPQERDEYRAERIRNYVRPVLEDGNMIMHNTQIFRTLVMKAPGITLSYERAKKIITDKIPDYSNNELLASHPKLMPYMVTLRVPSLNAWSEKAYVNYLVGFDCESKLWLTKKEAEWCEASGIKGIRTDKAIKPPQRKMWYQDVEGHTQSVMMPYFIQMGFANGNKFERMTKIPSLFLISDEIPYASIESIPPLKNNPTSSGPTSSVPPEIIEKYATSTQPDVAGAVKAYGRGGVPAGLPGFYKPPRP